MPPKSFFLLFLPFCLGARFYTEEPPVKLLAVQSVATRFPAAASQYRDSVENGHDEDAGRTEGEGLNDFPEMKLILSPGGCAFYTFPVSEEQVFGYIQPARKQGEYYPDYCNKASVSVELGTPSGGMTSFSCFEPSAEVDPCSSEVCKADISGLNLTPEDTTLTTKLCSLPDNSHLASLWEINFSSSNESHKIQGELMEEARERLRSLEEVDELNTQLSIVSIVGGRGVGKSTVASLLSGNSSMFTVGSGSVGTTTTGADISTVIPTQDWVDALSPNLGFTFPPQDKTLPLFLIDSEGMGVRGGTFDFITTSPPAVIAKAIVWIGVENLQTAKILDEIDKYLQGLNNIVMDEAKNSKENYCSHPAYGHFVVVINKMMGTATDEQLQTELMAPEPDYIEGALERNKIRQQLLECFDGVSVHGLPTLTNIPPGESIDYPYLDGRFKDGLGHIANSVLERVGTPRTVTVTGISRELNASNAEVIIATVIEEANKGQIDLTGFESFWTYTKQDIIVKLGRAAQEFNEVSAENCHQQSAELGYSCSPCVCSYRNSNIEETLVVIENQLDLAKTQAETLFGINIDQQIGEFYDDTILPWEAEQICNNPIRREQKTRGTACDISEMESSIIQPGQEVEVACDTLFLCGSIVMDAKEIRLNTNSIFVSADATIKTADQPKASNGQDGATAGADGGDGAEGVAAGSLTITASEKLAGSANTLIFQSKGGAGGDGGNGSPGEDKTGSVPAGPSTAEEVCAQGVQYDYTHTSDKHCGGHCHTDDEYWYFRLTVDYNACGGDGGQGGDGGAGGAAGQLTIVGSSGVTATNNRLESAGGLGGTGGAGAAGLDANREYLGWHRHWEDAGCHGFGGLVCGPSYHDAWGGYQYHNSDTTCSGRSGDSGSPGAPWMP